MKKITTSLACMMLLFTICICGRVCAQPLRIMPLGNSITQSEYTHLSYRYNLWQKLKAANVNFDFVGSMNTNYLGSPVYPDPSFDRDHEGHWLYRADSLLPGLPQWLMGYMPDVVLMHVGTNDVLQNQSTASTVQELKSIIDVIRARNPNVTILLAKLIGTTRSANTGIIALNNQMDGIAAEKTTSTSKVIVVDQYTGFDPVTDTQEGIHPNALGEEKMAQRWFEAITQLLMPGSGGTGLRAEYFNNTTLTAPVVSARIDPLVNFDWGTGSPGPGINADNYSARWTGQVESPITGNVIFSTVSDDGIRLWVNDVQVINNWTNHGATVNSSAPVALAAGVKYNVRMEYFENTGSAVARLLWSYTGQVQQPIPQGRLFPAAGSDVPVGSGTGLRAEYFTNMNLTAPAVSTRTDPQVNFDWGTGSPGVGINADGYSARWSGQVESPITGNVVFTTVSDDGVRLWINDVQVINNWTNHGATGNSSTPIALTTGVKYNLRMEYFENTGSAVARLLWSYTGQPQQPIPQGRLFPAAGSDVPVGSGTGLRAEYFTNMNLTAPAVSTRTDPQVNFDWGTGSPGSGVNADNYSIRWTGQVESPITGNVIFSTVSDDGVRLWINDVQVINNWTNHGATVNSSVPIALAAGVKYNVRMEYFENTGSAVARLLWSFTGQAQQPIPQGRLFPAAGSDVPVGGTGLSSEYFNNINLTAPVASTRTDAQVNFDWGIGSPGLGVNADNYSIRWTGQVESPITGSVVFTTVSDDGVRLWINDVQVINNWTNHAATGNSSTPIALTAGMRYNLRMEYFENTGSAVARLLWSYAGQSQQAIPQSRLYPATQSMTFARSFTADDDTDRLLANRQWDAMLHREFSCYPNPLREGDLHLVVTSAENTLCKIAIYASDTRLQAERCFYLAKGNNDLVIPLSDLSEGLNLVVLYRDDVTPVSRRVMVRRSVHSR